MDYISKPFQLEEVHSRVQTHLKLHHLQRALEGQNERLEEAVAARTHQLAEANQRLTILDRSKSDFLNLISHEFRTPLNGLLGAGGLIMEELPATTENNQLREMFEQSSRRIASMLDDALLLTEIDVLGERFRSAQVCLHAALLRALERTTEFASLHGVALAAPPAAPDLVLADEDLLVRALHALLETAIRFSESGETVEMTHRRGADSVGLVIESSGKTIPPAVIPKYFDLFSVEEASTPGRDVGLSPALAYRILSLFGGSVSVANRDPSGIRLTIWLKEATRHAASEAN